MTLLGAFAGSKIRTGRVRSASGLPHLPTPSVCSVPAAEGKRPVLILGGFFAGCGPPKVFAARISQVGHPFFSMERDAQTRGTGEELGSPPLPLSLPRLLFLKSSKFWISWAPS